MPINWIDTTDLSFNNLLLLERVQISWFPGWAPEAELALALKANPIVGWYLRHKCPEITPWLDKLDNFEVGDSSDPEVVFAAERKVLQSLNDLLVYVIDPEIYDDQPFLSWDSSELTSLADFSDKIVLDIGAVTGRLALVVASQAKTVYCVEPVENLRRFIMDKASRLGLKNLFAVDGLITEIPFPDGFADIVMGGHVYGDNPVEEWNELERATCPGGMVILCPGNMDEDNHAHQVLIEAGYHWGRFLEPGDDWRRKYWKTI